MAALCVVGCSRSFTAPSNAPSELRVEPGALSVAPDEVATLQIHGGHGPFTVQANASESGSDCGARVEGSAVTYRTCYRPFSQDVVTVTDTQSGRTVSVPVSVGAPFLASLTGSSITTQGCATVSVPVSGGKRPYAILAEDAGALAPCYADGGGAPLQVLDGSPVTELQFLAPQAAGTYNLTLMDSVERARAEPNPQNVTALRLVVTPALVDQRVLRVAPGQSLTIPLHTTQPVDVAFASGGNSSKGTAVAAGATVLYTAGPNANSVDHLILSPSDGQAATDLWVSVGNPQLATQELFANRLAVGDFNGDGIDDLVVGGDTGGQYASEVEVISGSTRGPVAGTSFFIHRSPRGFLALDVDHDLLSDLLIVNNSNGSSDTVELMHSAPGGTFSDEGPIVGAGSAWPDSVRLANGTEDLLVADGALLRSTGTPAHPSFTPDGKIGFSTFSSLQFVAPRLSSGPSWGAFKLGTSYDRTQVIIEYQPLQDSSPASQQIYPLAQGIDPNRQLWGVRTDLDGSGEESAVFLVNDQLVLYPSPGTGCMRRGTSITLDSATHEPGMVAMHLVRLRGFFEGHDAVGVGYEGQGGPAAHWRLFSLPPTRSGLLCNLVEFGGATPVPGPTGLPPFAGADSDVLRLASLATGDLNGDGLPDAEVTTASGLSLYLGGAGGAFAQGNQFALDGLPLQVDFAPATSSSDGRLLVFEPLSYSLQQMVAVHNALPSDAGPVSSLAYEGAPISSPGLAGAALRQGKIWQVVSQDTAYAVQVLPLSGGEPELTVALPTGGASADLTMGTVFSDPRQADAMWTLFFNPANGAPKLFQVASASDGGLAVHGPYSSDAGLVPISFAVVDDGTSSVPTLAGFLPSKSTYVLAQPASADPASLTVLAPPPSLVDGGMLVTGCSPDAAKGKVVVARGDHPYALARFYVNSSPSCLNTGSDGAQVLAVYDLAEGKAPSGHIVTGGPANRHDMASAVVEPGSNGERILIGSNDQPGLIRIGQVATTNWYFQSTLLEGSIFALRQIELPSADGGHQAVVAGEISSGTLRVIGGP